MTANFRTLSLLSLAGLGACVTSTPVDSGMVPQSGASVDPADVPHDWLAEVSVRLQAGARAIVPNGAHLVVPMPYGLAAGTITPGGLKLQRRGGAELSVRLDGLRRGEDAQALGEASAQLGDCIPGQTDPMGDCVRAAERQLDGVTEWFIGLDHGVEQGFTFDERPLDGAGLLEIELAVDGALALDTDGDTAWLTDAEGQTWTVSDLAAWDANGEPLPVIFETEGELLRVLVEDEGAAYPITVDPVYSTVTTLSPNSSYGVQQYFGVEVHSAGDLDGDGYDDVIVSNPGALQANSSASNMKLYLYLGTSTGAFTTSTTWAWTSNTTANFGYAVATGDFNGDGFRDIALGAPSSNSGAGLVQLYPGRSGAVPSTSAGSVTGAAGDAFGTSISMAGDLNNDGCDDMVVGAPNANGGAGKVYVIYGNTSWSFSRTASTTDTYTGSTTGADLGLQVAIAGDLNGDGYDDVVLGAPGAGSGGAAYVYHGSGSGLGSSPNRTLTVSSTSEFGEVIAPIGDVNGDGWDDVVIADPGYNGNHGRAFLYRGSGSGLPSTASQNLSAYATSISHFGAVVSGVGDLNADGYDDFVVRQQRSTGYGFELYHGASGAATANAADWFSSTSSTFANSISGGGDFNGDGYADFVVGSYGSSSSVSGSATVYFGMADVDRDGVEASVDCDDNDANVGTAGTWYRDSDGDGHGASGSTSACTAPAGYVSTNDDCDDANAAAHPNATELVANGVDEDCDDEERCYRDRDADGAYDSGSTVASSDLDCTDAGESDGTGPIDCDDRDELRNPNATELPADGVDQDCDELELCYTDADIDGYRGEGTVSSPDLDCAEVGLAGADTVEGDCADEDATVYPGAPERAGDEIDSDCDGTELCYVDQDGDGYVVSLTSTVSSADTDCADSGEASGAASVGDCDDTSAAANPRASETPGDGVDGDCDGQERCFVDQDGDGYYGEHIVGDTDLSCASSGGLDVLPGDCNDEIFVVNPGVTEEPGDQIDQNCDGSDELVVDEGEVVPETGRGSDGEGCGGCSSRGSSPLASFFGLLGALGALFRRRS